MFILLLLLRKSTVFTKFTKLALILKLAESLNAILLLVEFNVDFDVID